MMSIPSGRLVSPCQTMATSCPVTSRSATARSRSQLEPGKTMTALFMVVASCSGAFDAVILDHRVGEQLAAHLVDLGVAGAIGQVQLDDLADAHVLHAAEAEPGQRMMHGLALRIEHAGLEGDDNAGFHGPGSGGR